MHMLYAGGGIGCLVHDIRCGETVGDAADLAMDVDIDIAGAPDPLVVQERRPRLHRCDRIEHRRERLVGYIDQPARRFGDALGLCDDRRHALADEAHHIVQNIGVVGVDQMILMQRGAEEPARDVLPGEDRDDARQGGGARPVDVENACVGMGRSQRLEV